MRRLFSLGVLLGAVALVLAGCNGATTSKQGADLTAGKKLFSQKCGACHTMKAANTNGQIGPNLDHAFGYANGDGFDDSTFFEITLHQMEIANLPMPQFDNKGTDTYLPEEDRVAIAAFVAECATVAKSSDPACAPGESSNSTDGKTIFTQNCSSCHTLQAAGSTGTVGPNLDQAKPTLELALKQIANGGGGMPAFGDTLTEKQIQAVAKFVVASTS